MSATIKYVVLKHQEKEDGTFNVKFRLTHDRKSAYIPTNIFVTKNQLNDKYQIKDKDATIILDRDILKYRKSLMKIDNLHLYDAKGLAEKLVSETSSKTAKLDFLEFMKSLIDSMKLEGRQSYENYQASYNHLYKFTRGELSFTDLTSSVLRSFEKHLFKKGVGMSGISKYMACIRATFNLGREEYNDEDLGDIKIPNNPFSKYKVPVMPESDVKSAGIDTVLLMQNYIPRNGQEEFARDIFMLSFYLIGMNTKDMYICESKTDDGRITYQRSKTKNKRSDNAEISIKIESEALELFNKYKREKSNNTFLFQDKHINVKAMNTALSRGFSSIRENLKTTIDKKEYRKLNIDTLTMYSARHSWATIASHNCNIIDSHIAKCLNHSSLDFKVTNKYIKRDWSLIDECNRKVLDYVNSRLSEIE